MTLSQASSPQPFLSVVGLSVQFPTEDGLVQAVDGVTLSVEKGKTLAIVGESGSGKSVTAQAIMGLLDRNHAQVTGEVWLDDVELISQTEDQVRALRGLKMGMIFQDPMSSLHPFYRIGDQIVEAITAHRTVSKVAARREVVEMLDRVGIPVPERRFDDYPHQLSGGMRQRVMIGMALINSPALLIADEPTTALDVTIQAQILDLISSLQAETGTTVILITHDLGIVADVADEVGVMYGGRLVEVARTETLYDRPEMPYTLGLLSSIPRMDRERPDRLDPIPGNPPSPINLPPGCVFAPRCTYAHLVGGDTCATVRPDLLESEPDHLVRCHLPPTERRRIATDVMRELTVTPL